MSINCKKHPNAGHALLFSNGKYKFCMDCVAERLIDLGLTDIATPEEKQASLKKLDGESVKTE